MATNHSYRVLAATILVTLMILNTAGYLAHLVPRAEAATTIITGNVVWEDETRYIVGDLVIDSGANLTLKNTTLVMNLTADGQYNITIKPGGVLWVVDDSTVKSNSSYRFNIYMQPGSILYIDNSTLVSLGYSTQPGLQAIGNYTHRVHVTVANAQVEITSLLLANATVTIENTNTTIYSSVSAVNILQIGHGTSLTVNQSNITIPGTLRAGDLISIPGVYDDYAANGSSVKIIDSNITGLFERLVAAGPWDGNLTITVKGCYVENTYAYGGPSYLSRNVKLYVYDSTIVHPSPTVPLFYVENNNILEVHNSKLVNGYIYLYWQSYTKGWERANLTDSRIDYGIMIPDLYRITLEGLYIDNVTNSKGQKLLLVKGRSGEYVIAGSDNPYQIIVIDSPGPIVIEDVKLNETYQPLITTNSTVKLQSSTIIIEGDDDTNFIPRAILSINNTNILVNNTKIIQVVTYGGGSLIQFTNGGNLTIINSKLNSTGRHYLLDFTRQTNETDNKLYIKLENTTIDIDSLVRIVEGTSVHAQDPIVIFDNTTWRGYGTGKKLSFYLYNIRLTVNNSKFLDVYSTSPCYGCPSTIFYPLGQTILEVNNTAINMSGLYLVTDGGDGVTIRLFNDNITYRTTWTSPIFVITINYDYGLFWAENNTISAPGYQRHVGFAEISCSGVGETIKIINNTITGALEGIFIASSVETSRFITIKDNNFTDMGGIIFESGANANQTIQGNTIAGEPIIYLVGATNLMIGENESYPIGQLILAYSENATITGFHSHKENIGVQVLYSKNVTLQNITYSNTTTWLTIASIVAANTTGLTIEESAINQTIRQAPFTVSGVTRAGIYIINSEDALITRSNLILSRTSESGSIIVYAYNSYLNVTHSNIVLNESVTITNPYGIIAKYSTLLVEDVNATLHAADSVFIYGYYSGVALVNSSLYDPDYGIGVDTQESQVFVLSTSFTGIFDKAIDVYKGGPLYIQDIRVNAATSGIYASSLQSWTTIRDSYINGSIDIRYLEDVLISNVTAYNNVSGNNGLIIYGSSEVFVINSQLTRKGSFSTIYNYNLYIYGSHNVTLLNATLNGGTGHGVYITYSSDAVIVNSEIAGNNATGIYVTSSSSLSGYYLGILENGRYSASQSYEGIHIDSGEIRIYKSTISTNYGLGAYATVTANLTYNYWGSASGPELLDNASLADNIDPEEILDPANASLTGNKVLYDPFLTSEPVRDTIPPTGWLDAPENESTLLGLANLTVRGRDNEGVAFTVIMVDGRVEAVLYGTNQTYRWDTTTVSDGYHKVNLITVDYAGNIDNETYIFKVSNIHPYVEVIKPTDNFTWAGGLFPVTVYSSDNNPDKLEVFVNGSLKATWTGSQAVGERTYVVDTRVYADGDVIEVKFVLTDLDGFNDTGLVYLRIDNTPPTSQIVEPTNNSYVPGLFNITVHLNDNMAFQRGDLYLNNTLVLQTDAVGDQSFEVNLSNYGYVTGDIVAVNLTAFDQANNTNTTLHYYIVDMDYPTVEITSPANNSQVSGVVDIMFTSSDNYRVTRVIIFINGTVVFNQSYNSTSVEDTYSWNTSDYSQGIYKIEIVALDIAGNMNKTVYYFEVLPTPIPESSYTALIVMIVTVIVLFGILNRRGHT